MVLGRWIGLWTALSGLMAVTGAAELPVPESSQAKNVILMIADGCGIEAYTLARWVKGKPLAVDTMQVALVRTHSSDSVITDSAPAATAYATGVQTSNDFISVGPKAKVLSVLEPPAADLSYRPLATVLEGAKLLGKSTGIVVTCRVTHATPAAFLAHVPDRDDEQNIMTQIVHQNADVVLGGGRELLLPKPLGGKRTDDRDLTRVLKARGYQMPKTRQELDQITGGKVFGLFAQGHMAPEIDRPLLAPDEPHLEEMTQKAIQLLHTDPDGFFLMVEGSQIDWACHANDPAYLVQEMLMFDRAVELAVKFARQDRQTLVIVVSDHATGGVSLGNMGPLSKGNVPVEAVVEPIRRMKCSFAALWKKLEVDPTAQRLQEVLRDQWGIELTAQQASELLTEAKRGAPYLLAALCQRYTVVGWTTHGHTGGDVPLFTWGPGSPKGVLGSAQVGQAIAQALGLDMEKLNARLFAEPTKLLPDVKVQLLPDTSTTGKKLMSSEKPPSKTSEEQRTAEVTEPQMVRLQYGTKSVELPLQENLLKIGDQTFELEGLSLYVPQTKRLYVPMQVFRWLTDSPVELPPITRSHSHER
ncbi:MAG: alkaline phosphatase [Thermoguttaceae bacterium]|nr:alkaline phosphatase [Thermoguttaceae bacterium]MDW8038672.1 alkaline phosphatase [Thermoguttaceae bacterium]